MSGKNEEVRLWQDWTNPNFFENASGGERRFFSLFICQFMSPRMPRTKLTLTGWVLILVALGIGSAAYNTASNILFLSLSLLLSTLVLSGILSQINFRKLQWVLRVPKHLRAGERGLAEIELRNEKHFFPSMSLCFRIGNSESVRTESIYLPTVISAGARSSVDWGFVPSQRGRFRVELSAVESQFPFSFLMKSLGISLSEEVIVWPKRVEFSFEPERLGYRHHMGGARKQPGAGSDLLNIRAYERGDSPRLVHWKASARMGKLVVRQFAQEGVGGFHLYVDPTDSGWTEAGFEVLCALVCSLADHLFHAGRLESFQLAGSARVVVRDVRALHEVYGMLALLERSANCVAGELGMLSSRVTFRPMAEPGVAIFMGDQQVGYAYE